MTSTQQDIARRLGVIAGLSPGVRFGQMLAHLGFLAEDMFDLKLWDIGDEQFVQVLSRHEAELSQRQSNVA